MKPKQEPCIRNPWFMDFCVHVHCRQCKRYDFLRLLRTPWSQYWIVCLIQQSSFCTCRTRPQAPNKMSSTCIWCKRQCSLFQSTTLKIKSPFVLFTFFFRAEALQSIVQLMGEKEVYDYHRETYRVQNIEWTQEKARSVLNAWQRQFTQVRHSGATVCTVHVCNLGKTLTFDIQSVRL